MSWLSAAATAEREGRSCGESKNATKNDDEHSQTLTHTFSHTHSYIQLETHAQIKIHTIEEHNGICGARTYMKEVRVSED